ncbi:MAG: hypothetical protein H8E32_05365 [Nitrospinae bacterium]|nr:hypothetical protein [Nitrospinota bacterium]
MVNVKKIFIVFLFLIIPIKNDAADFTDLAGFMGRMSDPPWSAPTDMSSGCGPSYSQTKEGGYLRSTCCSGAGCSEASSAGHLAVGPITFSATGDFQSPATGEVYVENVGDFIAPPPDMTQYLGVKGFNNGVIFDEDGTVLPPVDSGDMPLQNVRCIGIGGPSHCFGEGATSGITYDSWVDAGNNATASDIAEGFAFARASGMDIHDSRDRDIQEFATGQSVIEESIEGWGYRGKKLNGDIVLLFNPSNSDGSAFSTSLDMKTKVSAQGIPINTGYGNTSPGTTQNSKSSFTAVESAVSSASGGGSFGGGSGGSISIGSNSIVVTDSSQNVINRIDIAGEGLTTAEQDNLKNNILGTGLNDGAAVSVVGDTSGGSTGVDTGPLLPSGSAPGAAGGAGSSPAGSIGGADGFFGSGSKFGGAGGAGGTTCETVTCLVQEHNTAWEQTPLFTVINSLNPGNFTSVLPTICIPAFGVSHCFDFNTFSFVFDLMGGVVLIVSTFLAFSIIITRTKA